MRINQSLQGLKNAERKIAQSASRIAQWGLSDINDTGADPLNQDYVEITGANRQRLYASQPARVNSLADEAIQMKQAEFAYRANLGSIDALLDMDKALLEIHDDQDNE